MLFIYDKKAKVSEWKKEATSNAHHNVVRLVGKHLLVKLYAFIVGIAGMIDAQTRAKNASKPFGKLSRQHDFRKHVKHLLAFLDGLLNKVDVDFRLAAACHAMKKTDIMRLPLFLDALHRLLLVWSQRRSDPFLMGRLCSFDGLGKCFEYAFLAKFSKDGVRAIRFLQQF